MPGNKTAREQGFARMVKLLKEMKQVSVVESGGRTTVAGKAAEKAVECHTTGDDKPAGTM